MNAGPSEEPAPPEPAESHTAVWIRGLALIAGIVVLIVLARTLPVGSWIAEFNHLVADLGAAGVLVFIAVFAVAMVLFVPGTFFALGAGFAFGLGWGMFAAVSGATLGATAAFLIARYAARDWVRGWTRERRRLKALDRAVARKGWRVVALLRLSPVFPFPVLNYVLGLTGVRLVSYVAATAAGILPGTFLYVAIGYAGRTGLQPSPEPGDQLRLVILGGVLLLTLGITVYLTAYARRVLRAEEGWAEAPPGGGG